MFKFRQSIFTRGLCLLLASSLFYLSCTSDPLPPQNGCSQISLNDVNNDDVITSMEVMLDYAKSVDHQEDFTTFGEYHATLFGQSDEALSFVSAFEQEAASYSSLGFVDYVNSNDMASSELKSYIIDYSQELTNFLNNDQPNLSEFTNFINVEISELDQSSLCQQDKDLMNLYLAGSQGYANWFYKNFYVEITSDAQPRSCDFFEAIGCGLLATFVTIYTFGTVAGLVMVANFFVNGQPVSISNRVELAVVSGIALGIYAGVSVYAWCCGTNEVDEMECLAPTGSSYIKSSCNEITYRVFGPSTYGATDWSNVNTDPNTLITPTPKLTFTVPNAGETSDMIAVITCLQNGNTVQLFDWMDNQTFDISEDVFPLEWVQAPPAVYDYQFPGIIKASVNTPDVSYLEYTWTVNSPHIITNGGNGNKATIKVNSQSSLLVTTVKVKNTCTNETESLLAETDIQ